MLEAILSLGKAKLKGALRRNYVPVKLTVALTYLCNSRCKTCNIWKIYRENPGLQKQELAFEEWKKLFDELKTDLVWVDFTGGEPTLRRDVVEILSYVFNQTTISFGSVTTNAISRRRSLRVIEDIISKIPNKKILNVGISLDGLPEVHDSIRGIPKSFDNATWLFLKLRELRFDYPNLNVYFSYTISRFNAGKFQEFFEYMKETYNTTILDFSVTLEHTSAYYNREREKNTEDFYFDIHQNVYKDITYLLNVLEKERVGRGHLPMIGRIKQKFYSFYLRNILNFITQPQKMIFPCVAARYSGYVDPYGNVYPCTQWNLRLGNVRKESFKKIWASPETNNIRELISRGKCPNCWTPCEAQPSWVMNFGIILYK